MQNQQAYPVTYSPHPTPMPRYSSSHSTSSAFSASAQPNEDWTKISDLAERRRIQNRIAQRNYRKKIKRRLEDLEKRASSSPSPEQNFRELHSLPKPASRRSTGSRRQSIKRDALPQVARKPPPEPLVTPYSSILDGHSQSSPNEYKREVSLSPPHHLNYPCALPDTSSSSDYGHQTSYHSLSHPLSEFPPQSSYLPSLPSTLPAMPSYESSPAKPGHFFDEGNVTTQYNIGFTPFSSMELPMQQAYPDSNLNTPPLSHSRSFDRSRDGSPSMIFPVTPISNPNSPKMTFR